MSFEGRLKRIKSSSFEGKTIIYFFIFFIFYLIISGVINKFHIILPTLFRNNLNIILLFLILNLLIAITFAITINLAIYRYQESKQIRKHAGLAPAGALLGLLGGLCPGCFTGLFPALFAIFGITTTLTIFPLLGAEFLILALGLMFLSIWFLSNDQLICPVTKKKR